MQQFCTDTTPNRKEHVLEIVCPGLLSFQRNFFFCSAMNYVLTYVYFAKTKALIIFGSTINRISANKYCEELQHDLIIVR